MKTDLTKTFKTYYTAKAKPQIVHIEPAQFLSIAGKGDPSGELFAAHIQALYATAYALKFRCKEQGNDFVVAKLEGLWRFDEEKFGNPAMADAPRLIPRKEWEYRLLIRMPDFVTKEDMLQAMETVVHKKQIAMAGELTWFEMSEGKCIQMLHTGPYDTEPESLQLIADFSKEHKLAKNGLHHEIYLSDFRKTAPEKLKTILREPVREA